MDVDADVPAGATPAAYGKACSNCARAKCRCIYQPDGPDCVRCRRLNKQCLPSVSVRKRTGRRLLASRTEKLEEKLDGLFTLIQNQKIGQPNENLGLSNNIPSPPQITPPSATISEGSVIHPIITQNASYYTPSSNPPTSHQTPAAEPDATNTFDAYRTEAEADTDLHVFRTHMLNFFPYVYISPDTTSEQLREQRPVLWLAIMCITCKNSAVQVKMARALRTHVAMRVVVENEMSLDLLLGLITFVSWCYYNKKEKGFLATMTGLVSSLVLDLGLNRGPTVPNLVTCIKQYHDNSMTGCGRPTKPRTIEDRRTLLAAYYALSQPSMMPKKSEGMKWTSQMDDAVRVLSETPEYPGDTLLVALVKLQLLVEEMNAETWQSQQKIPPPLYISALRSQIESIKQEIPHDMQNNAAVVSTLYYLDVVIHESMIDWKSSTTPSKPDFSRYESLQAILSAIRGWFDFHFSTPFESRIGSSFTVWCQFAHIIISLYRITTLGDPALDRNAIRNSIDVISICETMATSFESVIAIYNFQSGGNGERDEHIFSKFCRIVRSLREKWISEIDVQGDHQSRAESEDNACSDEFIDGIQSGPLAVPLYPVDQSWFTDIFNVNWD